MHLKMLKHLFFEDLAKNADPNMILSVIGPTHNVKKHKFNLNICVIPQLFIVYKLYF